MAPNDYVIHWHDLPELCRAGKIAPAPSFLATKAFGVMRVPGVHPILEWYALYIFEDAGQNMLCVRAVEPDTYWDMEHAHPFDPENPETFSLMAQSEVQYMVPQNLGTPATAKALLLAVWGAVQQGTLSPDSDHCQTWYRTLDQLCDSLVWS